MKRVFRRAEGKGPLELIEEATHLLRTAGVAALASYYLGAIPFILVDGKRWVRGYHREERSRLSGELLLRELAAAVAV